jgi:transposase-like protein
VKSRLETTAISMALKDSGAMQKHGYRVVPKQYFHLYLKEIEFRFNHRQENVFTVLTNIVAKTVPNV